MPGRTSVFPYLYPVFAVATWGSNIVAGRFIVTNSPLNGIAVSYLRFLLATPLLASLVLLAGKRGLKPARRDLPLLALGGFLGVALFNIMLYTSLEYITASATAFLASMSSPLTYIILVAIGIERPRLRPIIGVSLSILGLYILLSRGISVNSLIGAFYAFIAALSWSGYTILVRFLASRYTPLQILTWAAITGTLMLTPISVGENLFYNDLIIMSLVVYIAIIPGALGYLAWNMGVDRVGAAKTAVFIPCVPLVATVLAVALLGESLTYMQIAGGTLIVVGIILVII